jgi:hypothetical protein
LPAFEEVFVAEGRERIGHHMRELYSRRVVIVSALERLDETLERSAEFLMPQVVRRKIEIKTPSEMLTAHRIAPTERIMAIRSRKSGMPSMDSGAARNTCSMRLSGQRSSDA